MSFKKTCNFCRFGVDREKGEDYNKRIDSKGAVGFETYGAFFVCPQGSIREKSLPMDDDERMEYDEQNDHSQGV